MEKKSSRELTKTWPYKRYADFEKVLREAASKWFEEKGFKTKPAMPYCLESFEMWDQNLITEGVREYIKEEIKNKSGDDPFPAHKYLHHGLSSQAMGFNLIGSMAGQRQLHFLIGDNYTSPKRAESGKPIR